jgi:major membrane immunogen (membrane-anchored lipoprotein)
MFSKRIALLSAILIVLIFSCTKNTSSVKDGYYTAEMADYDERGWKEYITIYVLSGKIINIEYDAVNNAGFVRSWDMALMRNMNASSGIYPNAYTRFYRNELLRHQDYNKIDSLSGATNSHSLFKQLAQAALESAKKGRTGVSLVYTAKPAEQNEKTISAEDE